MVVFLMDALFNDVICPHGFRGKDGGIVELVSTMFSDGWNAQMFQSDVPLMLF
jgi:hypothetical protein